MFHVKHFRHLFVEKSFTLAAGEQVRPSVSRAEASTLEDCSVPRGGASRQIQPLKLNGCDGVKPLQRVDFEPSRAAPWVLR